MTEAYYYSQKNSVTGLYEVILSDPGNGRRGTISSVVSRHRAKDAAEAKAHKLMLARSKH